LLPIALGVPIGFPEMQAINPRPEAFDSENTSLGLVKFVDVLLLLWI
jgi:hypothetical protein